MEEIKGVFVPWNDPDETPLEAIERLNTEAVTAKRRLAEISTLHSKMAEVLKNAQF